MVVFRFGSELGLIGLEACLEPVHVETFFFKVIYIRFRLKKKLKWYYHGLISHPCECFQPCPLFLFRVPARKILGSSGCR